MRYFYRLLKATRSCRNFDPAKPVTEDMIFSVISLNRYVPSAMNLQELKFAYSADEKLNAAIYGTLKWAGYIGGIVPYEGKEPTGYIVICHDMRLRKTFCDIDVGISAQAMSLGIRELGFASCMIGSFSAEEISAILELPEYFVPRLVIAIGAPCEEQRIVTAEKSEGSRDSDIIYYRDAGDCHVVPKRPLSEIIIPNPGNGAVTYPNA